MAFLRFPSARTSSSGSQQRAARRLRPRGGPWTPAPLQPTTAAMRTIRSASWAPAAPSACSPGAAGAACPSGQTCCTVLALPPSSSCVPEGTCTGLSTECSSGSDCTGGQVCCAGSPDGGAMAADGGMPTFNPSDSEHHLPVKLHSLSAQYCSADAGACPAGLTCQSIGGGGGGGFALPSFCAMPRPDAGIIVPDSGVPDSGSPPDIGPRTPARRTPRRSEPLRVKLA